MADKNEAVCIDALADDIDLSSVFALMQNPDIVKVFHSARQDIEIFFNLTGEIPTPIFDTQIAAMVCGFRDSVSYQKLVLAVTGKNIDKGMRFSDWSRRPLSEKQIQYALADVTYLRNVYESLKAEVEKNHRQTWLKEEMAVLTSKETYIVNPDDAWKKIKNNASYPKRLAILKELAKWRELKAVQSNKPRKHILRDEQLIEIAISQPQSIDELRGLRGVANGIADGKYGGDIIEAVEKGLTYTLDEMPKLEVLPRKDKTLEQLTELLMMLLNIKCQIHNVAPKMVATKDEVELIAEDDKADVSALSGWRREVFGNDALLLKKGKIFIGYDDAQKQAVIVKNEQ